MIDHEAIRQAIAAYALGALPDEERAQTQHELLEHISGCGECAALLRDFREVGADLALAAQPVRPDAVLEERIMAAARDERAPAARSRRALVRKVVAMAATLGLVVTAVWSALVVTRDRRDSAALRAAVALAADPEARPIILRGGSGTLVLLRGRDGRAALIGNGVASPPRGTLFELWFIKGVTATPVTTFRPENGAVVLVLRADPVGYASVAVTIERGFARTPTSPPAYTGSISA